MRNKRYDPKLKPYNKKFSYSYSFGVYPTLDLLKIRPEVVLKVLLKEDGGGNDGVKEILDQCHTEGIPVEYNQKAIDRIAYKENTYAIGVFEKYESTLKDDENHIVLMEPSNMGNLGTVIRTMVGFGYSDLAIVKPAADIFAPKVVRAAMGALFGLRFHYYESFDQYLEIYSNHKVYPFTLNNGQDMREVSIEKPYTLLFGNEGSGLSKEFAQVGQPVYIPQSSKIDSLNLSIAAGVAMWHFSNISGEVSDSSNPPGG